MSLRLVYGLKTRDASYLSTFYPSRRIAEAAGLMGIDYEAFLYGEGSEEAIVRACEGTIVLARGELPPAFIERLESAGARVVNPGAAMALADDKLASARFFAERGVLHPATSPVDPADASPPRPYPFVCKPRYGKMGLGVRLVADDADWEALRGEAFFASSAYLVQDYVGASHGRDLRFFYARFDAGRPGWTPAPGGAEPCPSSVCALRSGPGFLSNAHAGGVMAPFDPPAGLRRTADALFARSGLVYGTVDFLLGADGSFPVCEMNACPGFEELERASGLDVAGAIVRSAMGL